MPRAMTAPLTHEAVLKIMYRRNPAKEAAILDIPAGEGALIKKLKDHGFHNLYAAEIRHGRFKFEKDPSVRFTMADMNHELPFKDSVFDIVFCLDGIEHLENIYQLIREFRRILKTGGLLYLSTPNIMNIRSRFKYLTSGYFPFYRELLHFHDKLTEEKKSSGVAGHINPAFWGQLNYSFFLNKLTLKTLGTNRLVPKQRWRDRLLRRYIIRKSRIRNFNADDMTSDKLLFGEILIMEVEKGSV